LLSIAVKVLQQAIFFVSFFLANLQLFYLFLIFSYHAIPANPPFLFETNNTVDCKKNRVKKFENIYGTVPEKRATFVQPILPAEIVK
jgi:hypothetical protein